MKEKILILGVSSFAGFSFYNYLKNKNYKLYGTFNKNLNIGKLNYDKIVLKRINFENNQKKFLNWIKILKPNYIIDFASICMVNESWKYSKKYFAINFYSKIKILNYIAKKKFLKKFIYISTPEVFGNTTKILNENLCNFKPSTPYALSKLALEKYLLSLNCGKKFIITRFSNFYGPYQPNYRLIPKVILTILNKKKITIDGDGLSKRNYIYADDFCSGIFKIIKSKSNKNIYHFSGDDFYSVNQIIKKICDIMNINFDHFIRFSKERKGKDKIYKLNSIKTRRNLSWKTKFDLDSGIKNTINFIEKNKKLINKRPYKFNINN